MNLLMLLGRDYKSDIRVRREAEALVELGHHVHVICERHEKRPTKEELNGVEITRVGSNSKPAFLIDKGIHLLTWYQPSVSYITYNILKNRKYDIIYCHNLLYAKIAIRLSSKYDIPFITDMHEMYSEAVRVWRENNSFSQNIHPKNLFKPISRYKNLEHFTISNSDGLVSVSSGISNYYEEEYEYDGYSTVVRNVPDLVRLDQMPSNQIPSKEGFTLTYIGGFTPQRGIELLIEAMPQIIDHIQDAKLVLVGDGSDQYVSSLIQLCHELDVKEYVEFTGWVDFDMIRSYYEISDVTLIPYYQKKASKYALPNKLFQAMAFRTPVISRDLPTMDQIIHDTGAGTTFGSEQPLSEVVIELSENHMLREKMGNRGRAAVENKFNIKHEIKNVCDLLDRIEKV